MGMKRDKRREKKRKEKQAQGPEDEYAGVGLLSSMRGGFKNAVGTGGESKKGPKTRADQVKDIVIWVVIAALLVLVFYRFGTRR